MRGKRPIHGVKRGPCTNIVDEMFHNMFVGPCHLNNRIAEVVSTADPSTKRRATEELVWRGGSHPSIFCQRKVKLLERLLERFRILYLLSLRLHAILPIEASFQLQ